MQFNVKTSVFSGYSGVELSYSGLNRFHYFFGCYFGMVYNVLSTNEDIYSRCIENTLLKVFYFLFVFFLYFFLNKNDNFRGRVFKSPPNVYKTTLLVSSPPRQRRHFDEVVFLGFISEDLFVRINLGSFFLGEGMTAINVCAK